MFEGFKLSMIDTGDAIIRVRYGAYSLMYNVTGGGIVHQMKRLPEEPCPPTKR